MEPASICTPEVVVNFKVIGQSVVVVAVAGGDDVHTRPAHIFILRNYFEIIVLDDHICRGFRSARVDCTSGLSLCLSVYLSLSEFNDLENQ
ncbi:hypothetical protein L596_001224 [Steinernema carpocapsae]|uniref:Uncharacterized protein n=1 Tax=Steinernema carpocapsae TaxID=34508 RepID=A0A4U8UKB6_STECR|nr:hypothetical protein L596_001224 [Steinernema carpocapsae]